MASAEAAQRGHAHIRGRGPDDKSDTYTDGSLPTGEGGTTENSPAVGWDDRVGGSPVHHCIGDRLMPRDWKGFEVSRGPERVRAAEGGVLMHDNSRTILLIAGILLLAAALGSHVGAGAARMNVRTESQVTTTEASTDGSVFHPEPRMIFIVEANAAMTDSFHRELEQVLSRTAQVALVPAQQAGDGTPVLLVRLSVSGWYTPIWSNTRVKAEWYYASDGDMEGLLAGEPIIMHDTDDVIRRVSGETRLISTMYGLFSRRYRAASLGERLGRELGNELTKTRSYP